MSRGRGPDFCLADLFAGTYPLAEAKGGTVVSRHRRQLCSSSGICGVAERTSKHTHTHGPGGARSPGNCFYCLREVPSFTNQKPLLQTQTHTRTHVHTQPNNAMLSRSVKRVQQTHTHKQTHPHQKKSDTSGKEKGFSDAGSGRANEGRFHAELNRVSRFPLVFFSALLPHHGHCCGKILRHSFFHSCGTAARYTVNGT